jgi:hypothetical protein
MEYCIVRRVKNTLHQLFISVSEQQQKMGLDLIKIFQVRCHQRQPQAITCDINEKRKQQSIELR